MTVDQVIDTLKLEKQQRVPSRFPCRAIMVGNIAEYCDLLEKLKTIPNVEVVPSDVLFSSADVLPAYDSLMDSQYKDKWLILPGVSEYLRLFSRGETQRQRFTKLWRYMGYGSDLGRIIIPLWGCRAQWHDKDLHLDGDERQKDFFFDCTTDISDPQTLKILVLSKQFDKYQNTLVNAANKVFSGIRSWYEYWSNPSVQYSEYVLITGRLRDMQSTAGDISVHVLPDTLSFIRAYLQGGYDVAEKWQNTLLRESENWGIVTLCWMMDGTPSKPKGLITMIGYKPFCPYDIDLEFYRDARSQFSIHEWIDVIIEAIDYNPDGYLDENGEVSERKKLYFLRRLLPFVEKRVNLIELAPKGTGKSYVFEKISKRGWLISGGTVSRASLIYDNAKKTGGLLTRFDFVGFDEVQSITFEQPGQIQQALKHYMEYGEIKGFDASLSSGAGVIVLGNIDADRFDTNKNMVANISEVFGESATLDRFHGFIPGWEIPRMTTGMIAKGWAINTEYFAEVMHALRDDLTYSAVVDAMIDFPSNADKRHMTAIKRLCTAFLKLLFPHVQTPNDIDRQEFIDYCLNPAIEMRSAIYKQLCIIDAKEYDVPSKRIPEIVCK